MKKRRHLDIIPSEIVTLAQERFERIKQGVEVWNQWREEHSDKKIRLHGVNLEGAKLAGIISFLLTTEAQSTQSEHKEKTL